MPIFLDRHDMRGLTAVDIADAHRKDLQIQARYGVSFLTYWFDAQRESGFCLIDAPDAETANRVHVEAHGDLAVDVIEVDLSAVEAFLGRIADPAPETAGGAAAPAPDAAFRAVMFTDIVDSTGMTARLGDVRGVEMVRAHDAIVRRSLGDLGGREVKHTGDGIMAAFDDVAAALRGARTIQAGFYIFNLGSAEELHVRIGLHAGEPVEDSNDLFGGTVQMAARLCAEAEADSILVSGTVRDLVPGDVAMTPLGARTLKGFAAPVEIYQAEWR